jgi:Protein of unknown function (Porph_ging).
MSAKSQNIRVTYQEQMVPTIQTNDPQMATAMKAQFSNMKKTMFLFYHKGESSYEPSLNNKENDPISDQSGSGIKLVMTGSSNTVYKNQNQQEVISQEYIMDRKFLITEPLLNFNWVLSNEEKLINNFKCKKAVDKTGNATAWYCPSIPISDGPYIFGGLPGLIIELSYMNKTVTALDVTQIKDDEVKIKKPTDGKAVTREEFNTIQQKKMKEMGAQSQGVNVKIDIQKR